LSCFVFSFFVFSRLVLSSLVLSCRGAKMTPYPSKRLMICIGQEEMGRDCRYSSNQKVHGIALIPSDVLLLHWLFASYCRVLSCLVLRFVVFCCLALSCLVLSFCPYLVWFLSCLFLSSASSSKSSSTTPSTTGLSPLIRKKCLLAWIRPNPNPNPNPYPNSNPNPNPYPQG
jgi:hypothetical protein